MNTNQADSVAKPSYLHIIRICPNIMRQAEILTSYINEGLLNNEGVIVVARPSLRKIVLSKLDGLGFDSQAIRNQGQVKFFDAEFLLTNILIDGVIEEQPFLNLIGIPVEDAQSKFGKVRAFGEMVDILWQRDHHDMAMQLEDLWEDLCAKQNLQFLCTYLLDNFDPYNYDSALEKIYKHPKYLESNLFNVELDETFHDAFVAAWNRVTGKLTKNYQIPQTS